jgi:hypothetical protein
LARISICDWRDGFTAGKFPVIYYISPQLWAWRSYRARNIRRDVDLLLTILPFEKEWYARRDMTHVEYVGHPLKGKVSAQFDRDEFLPPSSARSFAAHNCAPARQPAPGARAHFAADAGCASVISNNGPKLNS